MADDTTLYRFTNCRILRQGKLLDTDEALWIRGGRVQDPRRLFWDEKREADVDIDCGGLIASPGFIDVQINGAAGYDFTSGSNTKEALQSVARLIVKHGVTAFCPTIVSSLPSVYHKVLPQIVQYESQFGEARMLGAHLEGPFISKTKCGAHSEHAIRDGTESPITYQEILSCYGSLDRVRIITLAPEVCNKHEIVHRLSTREGKNKIVVSLGHSEAGLNLANKTVEQGARFITHLFNAMLPFHHRDPGIVGLLTRDKDKNSKDCIVYYGIISDGVHTEPAALRIAHRACPKGIVLVTDAIAAMGLGNGRHRLGNQEIIVEDSCRASVVGQTTLAGSVTTMDMCVRHFQEATECSIVETLEAATLHPAQLLGEEYDIGTLNFGSRADFVLLDSSLEVQRTYIGGQCVYDRESK